MLPRHSRKYDCKAIIRAYITNRFSVQMEKIDPVEYVNIKSRVRVIVACGTDVVHCREFKALLDFCKTSEPRMRELYNLLFDWLKHSHAEIRLNSFLAIDKIFYCSHYFRCLVIEDIILIAKLSIHGLCSSEGPQPSWAFNSLSEFAISSINKWYVQFAKGYYELELAHEYLRKHKYVNYAMGAVTTPADLSQIAAQQEKARQIKEMKLEKIRSEMEYYDMEMQIAVNTFNNCFELLIPNVNKFDINASPDNSEDECTNDVDDDVIPETTSDFMQTHGMTKNTTVKVDISDINKVRTTCDNQILMITLHDQVRLIKKRFLRFVHSWEKLAVPYSFTDGAMMMKIVDVKCSLENIVKRYESISILPPIADSDLEIEDTDSDSDLIDVPMEVSEIEMLGLRKKTFSNRSIGTISRRDRLEAGPSCVMEPAGEIASDPMPSHIDHFLAKEWEPSVSVVSNALDSNQIWSANEVLHDFEANKVPNVPGASTQIVDYQRQFEPVKWACRAPLPSGKLCPRKDREICPFHGPVISRSKSGKPTNTKDIVKDHLRQEEKERRNPAWQDPSLLADLERQTGVNLDMKQIRKRKGRYSHLSPIVKDNARSRLGKKLFSRKAKRK